MQDSGDSKVRLRKHSCLLRSKVSPELPDNGLFLVAVVVCLADPRPSDPSVCENVDGNQVGGAVLE